MLERLAGRPETILLEPGRALVGNAGLLLTRVEYLKHGAARNFAVVDAAMNDLLRPALYDAFHNIVPVRAGAGPDRRYEVVGPNFESADFLGHERDLAVEEGGLLAVMSAGAYGMSMSSNYNTRPRAAEVMVDGSQAHLPSAAAKPSCNFSRTSGSYRSLYSLPERSGLKCRLELRFWRTLHRDSHPLAHRCSAERGAASQRFFGRGLTRGDLGFHHRRSSRFPPARPDRRGPAGGAGHARLQRQQECKEAESQPPAPVTVSNVERATVPVTITAIGNVEPIQTVAIKSRIDGEIVAVHVRDGEDVSKGQPARAGRPLPAGTTQATGGGRGA